MAEIDRHSEYLFQPFVLKEKDVVVEGDGLHLGISLLHTFERSPHVLHRHWQDPFQKILAHLPVSQAEDDALTTLAGDDEVALHVAQPPPFVDFARSFVDRAFALNARL